MLAVLVVAMHLVVDFVYTILDLRIRFGESS
jgi:ABC-type dipeptide/oligopeptide/nickel transport system permease component